MKRESYMSKNELLDFLKIGILAGEVEIIAKRTPEKDWQRKMKCAATYLGNIVNERLKALAPEQLQTVSRRNKHTEIKLFTSDQIRLQGESRMEDAVTVDTDVLYDVVDLAMLSCFKCAQGDLVKDCRFRKHFHTIGVSVCRTNPKEGECEFSTSAIGEVKCVNPQYLEINGELTERL